jgi:hypothetical protein
MSCYVNIYSDFPSRCQQVWERIERSSQKGDRDLSVTAMLMAATAGFATPWEHLRSDNTKAEKRAWQGHPAFKDVSQEAYDRTLRRLSKQFSEPLLTSPFFQDEKSFCWKLGYCKELKQVRDVGEYGEGERNSKLKTVREFLVVLRNAFAHNNICAFGSDREIDRLSFFAEDAPRVNGQKKLIGWHVATTTVGGFNGFLKQWFDQIREPQLRLVLAESLELQDEMARD